MIPVLSTKHLRLTILLKVVRLRSIAEYLILNWISSTRQYFLYPFALPNNQGCYMFQKVLLQNGEPLQTWDTKWNYADQSPVCPVCANKYTIACWDLGLICSNSKILLILGFLKFYNFFNYSWVSILLVLGIQHSG